MGSTMTIDSARQGINETQLVAPKCRFCQAPLKHTFVDLGMSPLCESLIT